MADKRIKMLEQAIENFGSTQEKMNIGRRYFLQENDIMYRKKWRGVAGKTDNDEMYYQNVEDTTRANHKLPSGFAKTQIMQKVNYVLNDELSVTDSEDIYQEVIPNWKKLLKQTAMMTSQKIYEAWQPYIEDKQLKFKRIPGDQLIISFEGEAQETEKQIIRHYTVGDIEKAEVWTAESVAKYEKKAKSSKWEFIDEGPHIVRSVTDSQDNVVAQQADTWGVIPLIVLYNNDELKTDVDPIKNHIDVYDITNSDFANNIDDFQEIFAVLKGYGGSNPAEVLNLIKKIGGVNVGEGGDVDFKQGQIPVEARKQMLEILTKDIYDAGMAVNVDNIATGNVTNNTISAMYENLNMKAASFEQELQDFWRKLNYIINRYFEIVGDSRRVEGELVFDRTMLVNQKEKADQSKVEVETLAMLSSMIDVNLIANMIANLDFVQENSDLNEEDILKSVINKSQEFMIKE